MSQHLTTSGTVAPFAENRLTTGDRVGFSFQNLQLQDSLKPGMTTYWLEIDTNATQYTFGSTNIIDRCNASVLTFAPAPEPISMALFGMGFPGLGLLRFRNRPDK